MEILVGALLVTQAGTIIMVWLLWIYINTIREKSERDVKELSKVIGLQAEGSGNLTKLVGEIVQMLAPAKPPKPTGRDGKVIPWKDHPA